MSPLRVFLAGEGSGAFGCVFAARLAETGERVVADRRSGHVPLASSEASSEGLADLPPPD